MGSKFLQDSKRTFLFYCHPVQFQDHRVAISSLLLILETPYFIIIMSAIGSLIFCTDCGNLLRESTGSPDAILECGACGAKNKGNGNYQRRIHT